MSRIIKKGATSQSVYFEILDSTSTTGGRKTGLAYNTASLTAYYVRNGGSATAITLATLAAANSAYSSGGFKEVDSTNMPGVYRLDLPDAAVASGADSVAVTLRGATGMVQASIDIQLTAVDLQDAVRGGMTALPNANAEAAGGLYTRGTGAGQIAQQANGQIDVNLSTIKTQTVTCSAGVTVGAFVGNATTALAVDASGRVDVGKWVGNAVLVNDNSWPIVAMREALDVGSGDWAQISFDTASGNVNSIVQTVANNAITAASIATDAITEIQSGLATSSALATVAGYIDTEVAAIKAKTDNLPASPAATSDIPSAASVAAAVLAAGDIDGFSVEQTLKLCLSVLAAKLSGAGTTTIVIRATDDSKDRITATVDSNGNRSSVTLDAAG